MKSVFLQGNPEEEVYIEQSQGYVTKGEEHKVLQLKKALYGMKQAFRVWYNQIRDYFMVIIVSIYVVDLILCRGNDPTMCEEFKKYMKHSFDMKNLGKMRYLLGIEVNQVIEGIHISQKKYTKEILRRFSMEESNEVKKFKVPGSKIGKDQNGRKEGPT